MQGHYTPAFAQAMVLGFERQFEVDGGHQFDVLMGEAEDDEAEPLFEEDPWDDFDQHDDVLERAEEPSKAEKQAVMRLHQNTGHRAPLRLAKALVVAGASPSVVRAAKELVCDICKETKRPPSRRPSSLPKPRHFGDQLHVDLVSMKDIHGETHWVIHAIDAVSGYQVARVMENKSADAAALFFEQMWIPILGSPKVIVADLGPEFTSDRFQRSLDFHDVLLHHVPVESPWMNGLAERAGGSLKVIVGALTKQFSCQGRHEMQSAVAAACDACNQDIGHTGYSPAQYVLGKAPRTSEEIIPQDLRTRLASHSLLENTPSLARQAALKEAARIAMIRMRYSQSLRRAEFTRARKAVPWESFKIGDLVYFYREQKVAPGGGSRGSRKKKLLLRQWHGPALVAALEGGRTPTSAYLTYRGNLTKCAIEHIRHATSLERLASEEWDQLLQDVLRASEEPPGELEDAPVEDAEAPQEEPEPLNDQEGLEEAPYLSSSRNPSTSSVTYPYPFSAADLVPLVVASSSRTSELLSMSQSLQSSMPTSLSPSRRTSRSSTAMDEKSGRPRVPTSENPLAPVAEERTEAPARSSFTPEELAEHSPSYSPSIAPRQEGDAQLPGDPAMASEDRSARLERAQGSVRRALSEGATVEERDAKRRAFVPLTLGDKTIDVLLSEQDTCVHPLLRAVQQAQEDIRNGNLSLSDHGSWDGRWPLLSRLEVEAALENEQMLPFGGVVPGHEVLQTGAHKEIVWKYLSEADKEKFREAARDQRSKWVENNAIQVLSLQQSRQVRQELERKGELEKILKPRFVLTDKNSSLRTPETPMPLKANARIVVPGFRDLANLQGQLRRDSPTGSRLAQHLLFSIAACRPHWHLRAADVRAAFLKGDPYVSRVLYISNTDPNKGPSIPLVQGGLAKVLKGVFGLADAPTFG